ncbi:hypothetical protein ACEWY4_027230 [Coilia grayii]|uniref:Uncharacterized protein n=1 Tax=Coilia grayii TaxID=363190 RepID=A0ABD1IRY1_9TELE
MCVLTTASAILALLALTGADSDCEQFDKPLDIKDLTPFMGKWWFLTGFCEHELFGNILKITNSSWVTLAPTDQAGSILMSQGNMYNGKCEFVMINMTLKDNFLHVNPMFEGEEVTAKTKILPSDPHYLVLNLIYEVAGVTIKSLYLLGRSGRVSDTALRAFQKQAECMGYSGPAQYTYDGVTELCDQDQHKAKCEPLVKAQEVKDVTPYMGRWVFLMGYLNSKMFIDLLKTTTSSWMIWTPTTQKDTFSISQGNMMNGTCRFSSSNANISSSVLHAAEVYEGVLVTTKGFFLPSGQDTLVLQFESQMVGLNIKSVYMFGRSGKASAADVEAFQKQAECLGWARDAHYTYDGVTEFCEKS